VRSCAAIVVLAISGCGVSLLPTTLFYAPLTEPEAPGASTWTALLAQAPAASRGSGAPSSVVAVEQLDDDDWLAWTATSTTDASRVDGTLVHARRTIGGLEAQSIGAHVGPAVRVTLRRIHVDRTALFLIESSAEDRSIERSAWIYVEDGARIVPADLGDGGRLLPVHRASTSHVDARWDRERTVTATFEGAGDALLVHEHATTREIAREHPEIPPRAVREIDRDRRLILDGDRLVADRASLFDEP
jgi:hypothetical protein